MLRREEVGAQTRCCSQGFLLSPHSRSGDGSGWPCARTAASTASGLFPCTLWLLLSSPPPSLHQPTLCSAHVLGSSQSFISGMSQTFSLSFIPFSFHVLLQSVWYRPSINPVDPSKVRPGIFHASSRWFPPTSPNTVLRYPWILISDPHGCHQLLEPATANSSPASHFSPLKKQGEKNCLFLLAVMELPRSHGLEMISQHAC